MNKIQTPGRHPFSIPVKGGQPIEGVRLVGNQPGKTLVVTAGVHGDEYVGIQAVRELLAQLSPGELSGQIVCRWSTPVAFSLAPTVSRRTGKI